ncbi:zinc finger protein GLIS3 isoform X1 [Paramormyrops kingsleyae]|uniref:zinc finger protein GLIS3 isoform X1 n=1 Tax=Paramormyrops kingsleyae TaxID=1676925 RepID=UPI000CD6076F|nr:zinc finger protein GLIS3 isoform X1 [Paramormyrops kingsleyae]XP_023664234.1 zinc finger protein GLIS3 isoform X1 [Paramormyrops kingsleyae]
MNGKVCNLVVSPTTVPRSMGAMARHQTAPVRVHAGSPGHHGLHSPAVSHTSSGGYSQRQSSTLLPALSLRRQALTGGKQQIGLGTPQPHRQQAPAHLHSPSISSSNQDLLPNFSEGRVKGNAVSGTCSLTPGSLGATNLVVTSSPMVVSPLSQFGAPGPQAPPCHPAGLAPPYTDARSLMSRDSLASTTLSLPESQSTLSSRQEWPFGYRVLPPLAAHQPPQCGGEGPDLPSLPLGSAATSNSTSLPAYLFKGDSSPFPSPRHSARSKKRALSMSPLSDGMGIDFNSIIRTSPTSLVAYINGSRGSPSSHLGLSPLQSEVYGHFLGIRGSCIPQVTLGHPGSTSPMPGPLPLCPEAECARMQQLEEQGVPEGSTPLSNMVVQPQVLPQEVGTLVPSTKCQPKLPNSCAIVPSGQLDLAALKATPPPQGPPPPYHSHRHVQQLPADLLGYAQLPLICLSPGQSSHLPPLPPCPMLEEEEAAEAEDLGTGHCCRWADCSAEYDQREELVRHIEKQHVDQRKGEDFTCFWAGCPRRFKPFNARYKLLIHMRVHSGEKPNKCTFDGCLKAFSRLENLKIHLRSHTGEKPYLCQHPGCHKAFSNSSDRAKHQRTHLDTKPYACQIPGCSKRYTDPSSLRKHVKAHSSKDQQARKKLRSSADREQDGLTDCLTIQPLQPPLPPHEVGESVGGPSPAPTHDLYKGLMSQSPGAASGHLCAGPGPAHLCPLQDSHSYGALSPFHLSPGQERLPAPPTPRPRKAEAPCQETCSPLSQSGNTAVADALLLQGFYGQIHSTCPPLYNSAAGPANPATSCHMAPDAGFQDGLAPGEVTQYSLDMFQKVLSGITVNDFHGAPQEFLEDQGPAMAEDTSFLQISAMDRSTSQLSCIYSEG